MSLALTQNYRAITPIFNYAQFVATGGTGPYTYSVLSNGSGGSINASTGYYTPPGLMTAYPATKMYDTIQVEDSLSAVATAQILVASPFFLVLEILQSQLGLDESHCYAFEQKIFQPTDSNLYVIVGIQSQKPFGNNNRPLSTDGSQVTQYLSMYTRLTIDIVSRGPSARDQSGLIPLALNSIYSQQQQDAMGFYLGKLPLDFNNVSGIDGAAIPYRFNLTWAMQHFVTLNQAVPYFNSFPTEQIYTDP